MLTMLLKCFYLLLVGIALVKCQENAGTSIAKSLRQCYNTTEFKKFNAPPSAINTLIDLIRKAEDGKTLLDARQLSYQLLHRFRQDGIVKYKNTDNPHILAYSPTGFQRAKNVIILQTLIPGDAKNFPNDTLTNLEQCTLHFLVSNTILTSVRGDESETCSNVGRYTSRSKRNAEVERVAIPNTRTIDLTDQSECPLEYGVMYTKWGPVQAGTLLAGIGASLQPQEYKFDADLEPVDSRYAVTLVGDIVEAALYQMSATPEIVGRGTWNSTLMPLYYVIDKNKDGHYEFTDAELRAGMDGLILALKMDDIKKRYEKIKISQILDMYYSSRGVFDKELRACNRKKLFADLVNDQTLRDQSLSFGRFYDSRVTFPYTPTEENIKYFTAGAVTEFIKYQDSMHDLDCLATDADATDRTATDLVVILDKNWEFNVIHGALSQLINEIDLDRFGSSITIMNGADGRIMLESTNNRLAFYEKFTLENYEKHPGGFNYKNVFEFADKTTKARIDQDKTDRSIGGRSTIVLFAPINAPSSSDNYLITSKKEEFKRYLPDLKILVLGQQAKDSYKVLVTNPDSDIYAFSSFDDITVRGATRALASRIRHIPRVIRNSECGSTWVDAMDSKTIDQFIEIGTANYYKISPQYFFGSGDHVIKFRGQGYGPLAVCYSQDYSLVINKYSGDNCKTINTDEYSINLSCNSDSVDSCKPYYIMVNSTSVKTTNARCADSKCRSPDYLRYTISTQQFGCTSNSSHVNLSYTLITYLFIFIVKQLF